jgi:hypothetical protein
MAKTAAMRIFLGLPGYEKMVLVSPSKKDSERFMRAVEFEIEQLKVLHNKGKDGD